ncbi:MAG: HAD family hydrolase [Culturomica sp.]|jgi:phosphoglycolate phosphatase|nr:HAD family hydrolase [Culturomica sp.]
MKNYTNIVWDWNGTLLDDLDAGVNTLNRMLEGRGLPLLTTEQYKAQFGFPVEPFYRQVGFDLERENLHEISVDFVRTYEEFAPDVRLHREVVETLQSLREAGKIQFILSALREELLQPMVEEFGLSLYFSQVCGSDNIYAIGKVDRGRRMVGLCGIRPEETLMIGDTLHDAEVAEALGFDVLLYTGGHNSADRLSGKGRVITNLLQIPDRILQ